MAVERLAAVLGRSDLLVATIGLTPDTRHELQACASAVTDLDTVDPAVALSGAESGRMALVCRTLTDLRRAATLASILPAVRGLVIAVLEAPHRHVPELPFLARTWSRRVGELRLDRSPRQGWILTVCFTEETPAGRMLADVVQVRAPGTDSPSLRVAMAGPGCTHWRPGDPGTSLVPVAGPLREPNDALVPDLVLRVLADRPGAAWGDPRTGVVDRLAAESVTWDRLGAPGAMDLARRVACLVRGVDQVPPIDEVCVNPIGFVRRPSLGIARLVQHGERWHVVGEGLPPVPMPVDGGITEAEVARLRRVRAVAIEWGRHTGPLAAVRTVAGLACAGVPLLADRIPFWAGSLGADLAAAITGAGADDMDDDLGREEWSVRHRRAALRTHSVRSRWRGLAAAAGAPVPADPTVSVLLCTKRPHHLAFALAQIGRQRRVKAETVLVLHGVPADHPAVREAVAEHEGDLTVVEVAAGEPFGTALTRGLAAAVGDFVAKWDDDDWYGPEFLADLLLAASYARADLIGCLAHLVYLEELDVTAVRPAGESERFSAHLSGGTLLLSRGTLRDLGGFPPVERHVDTGLIRALQAAGGRVYRSHGLGYIRHRRATGHTWQRSATEFLADADDHWPGFRPGALMELDGLDLDGRHVRLEPRLLTKVATGLRSVASSG